MNVGKVASLSGIVFLVLAYLWLAASITFAVFAILQAYFTEHFFIVWCPVSLLAGILGWATFSGIYSILGYVSIRAGRIR